MIALDLPAGAVELRNEDVARLREAAAAQAGRSTAARDLSLLLERALHGGRVALRHGELQTLIAVAQQSGQADLAQRLQDPTADER